MAFFEKMVDGLAKVLYGSTSETPAETNAATNKEENTENRHTSATNSHSSFADRTLKDLLHINALDQILEEEISLYKSYKQKCIQAYLYSHYIDTAFDAAYNGSPINIFYELIDGLPENLRNSNYFRRKFCDLVDGYFATCASILKERSGSVSFVYSYMRELKHFPEFARNKDRPGFAFAVHCYFATPHRFNGKIPQLRNPNSCSANGLQHQI